MSSPSSDIKAILSAALKAPDGPARADYLDGVCGDDEALREKVERLLAADAAAGSSLNGPAVSIPADEAASDAVPTEQYLPLPGEVGAGEWIGRYKLLQQIGEGGFGVVFMAEQTEPVQRRVALKIIKPGMDSKEVIARFEAERQALALMDHTNIAGVLDAGTTDAGRPFFVMELVKGVSITEYCDRHQLDTRARLDLFIPVCRAVQHAHQKGVIHRDLKPSNIMVTVYDDVAVPKVIDFGIAKATSRKLTEKTLFTNYGQFIGTPQYMSPEQSAHSALDIDTRADIYALGATLYELLAGRPPFDPQRLRSAGFVEVLRIIREDEPPLPSQCVSTLDDDSAAIAKRRHAEPASLSRLLRGDLDWIVMKALEKDRNRRYATPNDLAEDIERHLNLDPIQARPISGWERRWRWCRRNPAVASLAAALLLALVSGFLGVSWQWQRAENAARRESMNRRQAENQRSRADAQAELADQRAEEARRSARQAERAAKQASDYLYAARMNLAQRAWDDGQVGEVVDLLNATAPQQGEPDRRSLEWHYLSRMCNSYLAEFQLGRFSATDLAYSPDGQHLAASAFNAVRVWSIPDRVLRQSFPVSGQAQCIAFSPDSANVVSAVGVGNLEYENTITLWNIESGAARTIAKCHGGINQLVFSPDGERLAAAIAFSPITVIISKDDELRSGEIKVWSVADGAELCSIGFTLPNFKDRTKVYAAATEAPAANISFSPDGETLLGVTGLGKVKVWNADDGVELLELEGRSTRAVFSSDGQEVISSGATWSLPDGRLVAQRQNSPPWLTCNGNRAAWSEGGTFSIGDVESQKTIAVLRGHQGRADHLALCPDGWRVASSAGRVIRTWNGQGDQQALTLRHEAARKSPLGGQTSMNAAAVSPDGLRIATVVAGTIPFTPASIKIWDRVAGQELASISEDAGSCMNLEFNSDGSQLASAFYGQGAVVWDARTGGLLHRFADEGHYATYSPNGKLIATAGEKDRQDIVVIRDTTTGEQVGQPEVDWHSIDRIAYHPSGRSLLLGGRRVWEQPGQWQEDDVVAVWNLDNRSVVASRQGPTKQVTSMAYSPDGNLIAIASRSALHLLHATNLEVVKSLDEGAARVVFSPDGRRLLTAGSGMVRTWDLDSMQEVLRLRGAGGGMSFDATGSYFVAGSRYGDGSPDASDAAMAKVWDFRPLRADDKAERAAIGLIRYLAAQSLTDQQVQERIRQDRTISAAIRRQALSMWADCVTRKSMAGAMHDRELTK